MTIRSLGCLSRRRLHAWLVGVFLAIVAGLVAPQPVEADLFGYDLFDHPDGNQSPPGYGLRIDGLSFFVSGTGADSDVWSFSFNVMPGAMRVALDDVAMTLTLHGTALGGKDVNQDPAGPSTVDIWFQYDYSDPASVVDSGFFNGHPFVVLQQSSLSNPVGMGTLTFLDGNSTGNGIPNGTVVNMVSYGKDDGVGEIVTFKADEHRLNDLDPPYSDCNGLSPHPGCDFPVLFGWIGLVQDPTSFDARDVFHEGSQDWLATTPEPASFSLVGIGLLTLVWWKRRGSHR